MGIFTWTDAAIKNPVMVNHDYLEEDKVMYGQYAKLICPDDTEYETEYWGMYGEINGFDVYELVADWNKDYLSEENLEEKPKLEQFCGLWNYEKESLRHAGLSEDEIKEKDLEEQIRNYNRALNGWHMNLDMINDFKRNYQKSIMNNKYGNEWKRELGIAIACYDDQMRKLKYPIKLTRNRDIHGYDSLFISYTTQ